MAAILHQPEAESLASTERGLKQLKAPVLPINGSAEKAKCEDLETVVVGDDLEKFYQVGAQLPPQEKEELIEFLRRNVNVFAWNAYKAPGMNPSDWSSDVCSSDLGGQIEEIVGSQSLARQCLVATILHKPETESSTSRSEERRVGKEC